MQELWSEFAKKNHSIRGRDMKSIVTLCKGSEAQKNMAQDAVNRWWWPSLMMFGPPDNESKHTAQSMKWKIKRFTNDELRQKFIDMTIPQAEFIGLKVPDTELSFNKKTGHYDFGEIDWNEFWSVVKGHGPCNKQRMEDRINAHNDGEWVRKAAMAYAEKQKVKEPSQVA